MFLAGGAWACVPLHVSCPLYEWGMPNILQNIYTAQYSIKVFTDLIYEKQLMCYAHTVLYIQLICLFSLTNVT